MDAKLQLLLTARDMTAQGFASFQNRIQRATRSLTAFNGVIGGIVGAGSVAGLAMATKRTLDFSDAITKTADKIGLSTDSLQVYRYAAERSGVATNALDMGLQRFTRRLAEAAQGGGELSGILKQYNISAVAANGTVRATDDVLDDLAEAIRTASSDSERLRIAFKAFDSEGAALVNMLRNGKGGLDEYRASAARLGIVIDEALLRGAASANDAITDLTRALDTSFKTVLLSLAPDIQRIATETANWVSANRALITEDVPAYIGSLAESLGKVKSVFDAIPDDVKSAAGAGLVGRIVFGGWGPAKVITVLTLMNEQLDKFGMGARGAAHSLQDLAHHAKRAWEEMPEGWKKFLTFSIADMLPPSQAPEGPKHFPIGSHIPGYDDYAAEGGPSPAVPRRRSPPEMNLSAYEREIEIWWDEMEADHEAHWEKQRDDVVSYAQQMAGDSANAWADAWSLMQTDDWTNGQSVLGEISELHDRIEEQQRGHGERMAELSKRTAWAMQGSFADLFFDGMQGRLNSFEDYFDSFMKALQRSFAEYMAQMLMQKAFGEAAGGSGGGWVGAAVNLVGQILTRDSGGPVRPGQMYEIGVPEMLHIGSRQYLMMGGNQSGYAQPLAQASNGAGALSPEVHLHNINVLDPSIVANYLNTPAGEAAVLNIIRRNE